MILTCKVDSLAQNIQQTGLPTSTWTHDSIDPLRKMPTHFIQDLLVLLFFLNPHCVREVTEGQFVVRFVQQLRETHF